jgi:transmembrane sensor
MNRPALRRILDRYASGHSPADERAVVEQWYALLDDPDRTDPQSVAEQNRLEARIWHRIRVQRRGDSVGPLRLGSGWLGAPGFRYGVAASVVLLLVAGWWLLRLQPAGNQPATAFADDAPTGLTTTQNQTRKPQRIALPDGSIVILQPGGQLRHPARFDPDKREVYLTGLAFFEITKNPKQPFFVYANELTAKVLGTSFWVRALPGERQVQVVVRTGRVSVCRRGPAATVPTRQPQTTAGLILTPNQQVVFDRQTVSFDKSLVARPLALRPFDFTFRNAPVSDVLRAVGQTYGIAIVYDEDLLARCPLTATLTRESLYEKLDLICQAIGADYQLIDGQIVINTKGCE